MIGKVKNAGSFGGVYRYALRPHEETQATIIGGNLGQTGIVASEMGQEVLIDQYHQAQDSFAIQDAVSLRELEKPVSHWVIGYPPDEVPSDQQARDHAESYIAGMIVLGEQPVLRDQPEAFRDARDEFKRDRLGHFQYSIIRHHDKEHSHTHIVLGRVDLETGKAINNSYIKYRSMTVCSELEKEFNLKRVNREVQSDTERDYYTASGQVLEPQLRRVWAANNYSPDFYIQGDEFDIRAHPATERNPERISLYRKNETKPSISVYKSPQPNTQKTFHARNISLSEAQKLRDRLSKLRLKDLKLKRQKREKLERQKREQSKGIER